MSNTVYCNDRGVSPQRRLVLCQKEMELALSEREKGLEEAMEIASQKSP